MRTILSIFVIFGFVCLSVFGFVDVNGNGGCLAETTSLTCALSDIIGHNPFATADHHIGAFKSFSVAILVTLSNILSIATLGFVIMLGIAAIKLNLAKPSFAAVSDDSPDQLSLFLKQKKLYFWLKNKGGSL
ncbi:MAG: hypothetical protein WC797_03485 [Candidatus Paceibacterota bacterium]|jgi:hypothetical protein